METRIAILLTNVNNARPLSQQHVLHKGGLPRNAVFRGMVKGPDFQSFGLGPFLVDKLGLASQIHQVEAVLILTLSVLWQESVHCESPVFLLVLDRRHGRL